MVSNWLGQQVRRILSILITVSFQKFRGPCLSCRVSPVCTHTPPLNVCLKSTEVEADLPTGNFSFWDHLRSTGKSLCFENTEAWGLLLRRKLKREEEETRAVIEVGWKILFKEDQKDCFVFDVFFP